MSTNPPTQPTASSLYPTMNSMQEVEAYAMSCVPIRSFNDLYTILKMHENTILHLLKH